MFKRLNLLGLTATMLFVATPASSQEVLNISSWAPPTHLMNAGVWPTWGKWVEEATEGRVTTKIEYGLASPLKQFELVRDGVADAAWIFHGYNTRYVATQVVEMPNLGTSAEAASVAYWRVHQKYLAKADEHKGVTLIGLTSHGPAVIQTKSPLNSLDDLSGQKIRVPGGVGSLVGKALGVTAVNCQRQRFTKRCRPVLPMASSCQWKHRKAFALRKWCPTSQSCLAASTMVVLPFS